MRLPRIFEEVGITAKQVELALGGSALVKTGVIDKAKEVQDYWKSIAPVGPREHTLTTGHVDRPGDYRDSIHVKYRRKANGYFMAIVFTHDYKAKWLEYGSIHNPEFGFAQRTVDHFNGGTLSGSDEDGYVVSG